jgi:L-lactate dehydrogenase complex protein LldG
MSSRDDILGRVRARLGRNGDNAVRATAKMETWLAARRQGPRPVVESDLIARFREKSEGLSSTVDEVDTLADVPAAIVRYLQRHGLQAKAVCWPILQGLPWQAAGLEVAFRGAKDEDLAGITSCFCAIAETGTLMLCSGPATPATVSLLPETHVAVVPASLIVPGMEEAWSLAREKLGDLPRAVSFISGPSRTGDIEQTIVLGAHGPYRVHLVIVHGA